MILLDTNVISELMKSTPEHAVERWFLMHEEETCLASVSIGELAYGIDKLDGGVRKTKFQNQLSEWRIRYVNRTFVFDVMAAMTYGDLLASARRRGRTMSVPDAQLAAIAKDQGCEIATRNTKDFTTTGLNLIDPWLQ